MKKWKEYLMKINGFEMKAVYNEETIRSIFLPLLKQLQKLQKQKGERIIVFMAAPPAVGKQVKGCPETYDTRKLRQKLECIKTGNILWPIYDRNLHDVVEDQTEVTKDIILIEGNWLLLKQDPWESMQQYADYKILILAEEQMLKERLISRKQKGGLSRKEAEDWYINSDSKNVTRVLKDSCQEHLDLLLQVEQDNDYLQVK